MITENEDLPLSHLVKIEDISAAGVTREVEPTDKQLKDLSSVLNLQSLDDFSFECQLSLKGSNRVHLDGRLEANVIQECVITLEPVKSRIEEDISIEFLPAEKLARLERMAEEEGIAIPIDGPEPLPEKAINIGHIAFEHLSAAIDPYPRKEDATFSWNDPAEEENTREGHPFAELEKLKNKN